VQASHKQYIQQIVFFEDKLKEAQAQLGTVQQDLNANISFAPHEGTLDREDLVSRFEVVSKQISTTSFDIVRRLPPELQDKPFSEYRGEKDNGIFEKDEIKFMHLASNLSRHKTLTCFDVLVPLLRHALSADIQTHVLCGFTPLNDHNRSVFLEELYSEVQKAESQEQGARWRAMTYTHMERDETKSVHLSAEQSLQRISMRIQDFFTASHDLISAEECGPHMQSLFESAAEFWSSSQKMCTKYHLEVVGSSYPINSSDYFPYEDKRKRATQIILTTKLGLYGHMKSDKSDDEEAIKSSALVKRAVIGDNWAGATYTRK
jgi:hypothetical protein